MGAAIVLAYIALYLLSPGDMLPALKQFRLSLLLALAAVPMAILARWRKPDLGNLSTQVVLVILFYGWALCSRLPHGDLGGNVRALLLLSPNLFVYFFVLFLLDSPEKLNALRATLLIVAIFVLINAFIGIPFARDTGITTPYDLTSHMRVHPYFVRIRGLGMLGDPNNLGHFLLMTLPMLYVNKKYTGLGVTSAIVISITILFLIGIYWSGSRGVEMGAAALLGLALVRRFKVAGAVVSLTVAALLVIAINNLNGPRTIDISGGTDRLAIWSDGLSYFKSSPIWGIGYDNFTAKQGKTAHNSYVLCAAELGFVGFFLWMSIIVVTFIQLNAVHKLLLKSNPVLARWAVALTFSISAYLFTAFFLSLTYELPLFMLLGMAGSIITSAGGDATVPLRGTKWPLWALGSCAGLLVVIYAASRLRLQ
jgi:putative inorganic carbon (hco3(-)) transporter